MENNSPWRWMRSLWYLVLFAGFALPFVTVADDVPGGFGRVGEGGATTYTGFDLATGDEPRVDDGDVLPPADQREDGVAPQPLLMLAVVGVIGAAAASITVNQRRSRRLVSAIAALASAAVLAAGQWVSQLRLTDLLTEQLNASGTVPAKDTGDYVSSAIGFWAIIAGLVSVAAVELYLMWRDVDADEVRGAHETRAEVSRNLADATR